MKLSCLPVSFFADIISGKMSVGDWARMGAEVGLEAVDLSILFVPDRSPSAVASLRDQIAAAGVDLAMVTSYPDFTHPDPRQRAIELEKEVQIVETARDLGARMVRVTAGQAHPLTGEEEGIEWAVAGLTCLAQLTANTGVALVYENHAKPGAWEYTDFCQPPEIFLEIVRKTAGYNLGVNFDTGNAATFSPDPIAMLEAVIDRVVSIHASDSSTRGELNHTLLGTGITPYREMFTCLKKHNWDGWICMEEASYQGREGLEIATAFVRKTWQEA